MNVAPMLAALAKYRLNNVDGVYDETLQVVVDRVGRVGHLTKADVGSLVLWKRISAQTSWARKLGNTPDAVVQEATARAFELANSDRPIHESGQEARWALNSLAGMSSSSEGALASAVLVACAPSRMAVWDRRVKAGLSHEAVGLPVVSGHRYYGRYLEAVVQLQALMSDASGQQVAPRDVDLALWQLGGEPSHKAPGP